MRLCHSLHGPARLLIGPPGLPGELPACPRELRPHQSVRDHAQVLVAVRPTLLKPRERDLEILRHRGGSGLVKVAGRFGGHIDENLERQSPEAQLRRGRPTHFAEGDLPQEWYGGPPPARRAPQRTGSCAPRRPSSAPRRKGPGSPRSVVRAPASRTTRCRTGPASRRAPTSGCDPPHRRESQPTAPLPPAPDRQVPAPAEIDRDERPAPPQPQLLLDGGSSEFGHKPDGFVSKRHGSDIG
ncbi:hypothetical protein VT03_23175 [Planctomyces sp. SH-PL14]|nr:hypothetical protein VT03_23175 [Planctomyces sp. SH-PL14]